MLCGFLKFGLFWYGLKNVVVRLSAWLKAVLIFPFYLFKKIYLFLFYIIKLFFVSMGKRGELRNKDILLTPQLSSSVRMLKFLSSCVLLFKKLVIVMPRFGTNRHGIFELGDKLNNRKIT